MSDFNDASATPLIEIPGLTAFQNIEDNDLSHWPDRESEDNRVEPLTLPGFQPTFRIAPGSTIFTIGSCFARNIEVKLQELGFDVPTRQMFQMKGASVGVLNNYTAPSVFNELNWALNPDAHYDAETHLYPTKHKFVDLHLGGRWAYPTSFDEAVVRRGMINDVYQSLKSAHVLIVTLGLVEAWYDTQTGVYLNSPPMKNLLKEYPTRFAVRVMRHSEVLDYLRRSCALLDKYCRADLKCVFTVSPVPLARTFRPDTDVILANTYSKSTLRSAVEEICMERENTFYFPSFESITLTERELAWEADQVHVTQNLVGINVTRMIEATIDSDDAQDTGSTDPMMQLQRAQRLSDTGDHATALDLLDASLVALPDNQQAIGLKIKCLNKLKRTDASFAFAQSLKDAGVPLESRNLVEIGRMALRAEDLTLARHYCDAALAAAPEGRQSLVFSGDLAMAEGNFSEAIRVFKHLADLARRALLPRFRLAQAYAATGEPEKALLHAKLVLEMESRHVPARNLIEELEQQISN